jgi:phage replication O-like protein O
MSQASPQVEDGYTRIADEFLEALIHADYPASVLRFVLVVVRETWGWQKKEAEIPTKRFVEVFGVTERRVRQIRDDCLRHNLIEVEHGDQFETPIYRVQKRYTDWMTWKTNNPWEGPSTRKTNLPSFPEDEPSDSSEDEPSYLLKRSTEKYRENDRARETNEDGERPRRDGQRLGETGDLPYLKSEYGNLWAACKDLPWPHGVGERWLQDIIAAMQSPADTWIADDDFAAAELLRENPPKGSEKHLPSKWLQRMEAQLPSATEAAAQSERERRMDEGRARAHRIAASNTAAERALRS